MEKVEKRLREIEEEHDIEILYAVECGSRVWGYALPESDYDVRFVYRHRLPKYLKLTGYKEVINVKEDDLDIVGYDASKALMMMRGTNNGMLEMCQSHIVYRESPWLYEFLEVAKHYCQPKRMMYSYLGMVFNKLNDIKKLEAVNPKHYLFVCRAVLAAKMMANGQLPHLSISDLMEDVADDFLFEKIEMLIKARCDGEDVACDNELNDALEREANELDAYAERMVIVPKNDDVVNEVFIKLMRGHVDELLR